MMKRYELNIGVEAQPTVAILGNVATMPTLSYYNPDTVGGAMQAVGGSQRPETNPPAPTNPRDNRN